MQYGYWFLVCDTIETVWSRCDSELESGALDERFPLDSEQVSLNKKEDKLRKLSLCRNSYLKYQAQMYNQYPMYKILSINSSFRKQLNERCHQTMRLIESGSFSWYPIDPSKREDDLGIALHGTSYFKVESTEDWFKSKDKWRFDPSKTGLQKNPVEIEGKMSEDLELFYSLQDMRELFDYRVNIYSDLCLKASDLLANPGERDLDKENAITSDPLYNYLSEEDKPRSILYYVCLLDDTLTWEETKAYYRNRKNFNKIFN